MDYETELNPTGGVGAIAMELGAKNPLEGALIEIKSEEGISGKSETEIGSIACGGIGSMDNGQGKKKRKRNRNRRRGGGNRGPRLETDFEGIPENPNSFDCNQHAMEIEARLVSLQKRMKEPDLITFSSQPSLASVTPNAPHPSLQDTRSESQDGLVRQLESWKIINPGSVTQVNEMLNQILQDAVQRSETLLEETGPETLQGQTASDTSMDEDVMEDVQAEISRAFDSIGSGIDYEETLGEDDRDINNNIITSTENDDRFHIDEILKRPNFPQSTSEYEWPDPVYCQVSENKTTSFEIQEEGGMKVEDEDNAESVAEVEKEIKTKSERAEFDNFNFESKEILHTGTIFEEERNSFDTDEMEILRRNIMLYSASEYSLPDFDPVYCQISKNEIGTNNVDTEEKTGMNLEGEGNIIENIDDFAIKNGKQEVEEEDDQIDIEEILGRKIIPLTTSDYEWVNDVSRVKIGIKEVTVEEFMQKYGGDELGTNFVTEEEVDDENNIGSSEFLIQNEVEEEESVDVGDKGIGLKNIPHSSSEYEWPDFQPVYCQISEKEAHNKPSGHQPLSRRITGILRRALTCSRKEKDGGSDDRANRPKTSGDDNAGKKIQDVGVSSGKKKKKHYTLPRNLKIV